MRKERITKEADLLVIGGGIAGTLAAIKAKEAGVDRVLQVDKGYVGKSGCSAFAAGIMLVFFPEENNFDDWFRGEVKYGGYLVHPGRIKAHMESIYPLIRDMESYGVQFLKSPDGKFERQSIRGKYPSVMFPGIQLMDALRKAALKKGVEQINKTMITGLLKRDSRVVGAAGFDTLKGEFHVFKSRATLLATGGTYYKGLQSGHRNCTADGYIMAYRAGAALGGAESGYMAANAFPARWDIGAGMNMYVGMGGKFINAQGERFMEKYSPRLKERALLNRLPIAFAMEVRQGHGPIYLDMTHFTPEQVQKLKIVLPLAMRMYESAGVVAGDRFVKPLEWMITPPNGQAGLVSNLMFESSLPGLFACGEAAAIRSYGSNLPTCATSGASAGRFAAEYAKNIDEPALEEEQVKDLMEYTFEPLQRKQGIEPDQVLLSLQETICPYGVMILRHGQRMKKAIEDVERIRDSQLPFLCAYDPHYLRMAHEARNLVFSAELQLRSALFRTESRLGIREDYPYTDNVNWLKWVNITKAEEGQMHLSAEDVPIEGYPLRPEYEKQLHPMWQIAERSGIISIEKGEVKWG
jgi:succinate dehydrogenase/fumarate reductase flavoprotein subunit